MGLFCGSMGDLSALLVVTHTHTQSLRTILLRFRGSLDTCHPHCSARTCAPGCQGRSFTIGVSHHMNPWTGALTSSGLVRGPCVSLPFEREPVEAAREAYVSFSGCDSSQFILPNLSLGSRGSRHAPLVVVFPRLSPGAVGRESGGRPSSWRFNLFCSGSLTSANRLSHGIFVSILLLWDCHSR